MQAIAARLEKMQRGEWQLLWEDAHSAAHIPRKADNRGPAQEAHIIETLIAYGCMGKALSYVMSPWSSQRHQRMVPC